MPGAVRYLDMMGFYQSAAGTAALLATDYRASSEWRTLNFTDGQSDIAHYNFQMQHNKKLGSPIVSVHIHFIPLASATGTVEFLTSYFWVGGMGTNIPAASDWGTSGGGYRVQKLVSLVPGDQYKQVISNLVADIPAPTPEGYSSWLLVSVRRDASVGNANDTYAGDLGLLGVDCHYQTDRDGSVYEYSDTPPGTI